MLRRAIPSSVPPKTQANTIRPELTSRAGNSCPYPPGPPFLTGAGSPQIPLWLSGRSAAVWLALSVECRMIPAVVLTPFSPFHHPDEIEMNRENTLVAMSPGPGPASSMRRYHAMVKPMGSICNLDCTYCYYLHRLRRLLWPPGGSEGRHYLPLCYGRRQRMGP